MDLLARVIGTPTFPEDALERIRTSALQSLKWRSRCLPQVNKAFQRTLFGDHPYGHPQSGTLESLPGIQGDDLVAFHQRYYAAGNAVIALVGDVSREQAEAIAEQLSEALPRGDAAPELAGPSVSRSVSPNVDFPSGKTHILIGNQATWHGNPDHVPLYGQLHPRRRGLRVPLTQKVRKRKATFTGCPAFADGRRRPLSCNCRPPTTTPTRRWLSMGIVRTSS